MSKSKTVEGFFNEKAKSLSKLGKVKALPVQAKVGPKVSRRFRLPGFSNNRHIKIASLSASRTGRL
jgi:hypothetical protein